MGTIDSPVFLQARRGGRGVVSWGHTKIRGVGILSLVGSEGMGREGDAITAAFFDHSSVWW